MPSKSVRAYFVIALIAIIGAASCGKKHARIAAPNTPTAKIGDEETGVASWYGIPYHGRATASGEIYDMEKLTAAHKRLPFETWVEVTNLDNGKKVDVRITDRGPFVKGRVIDLSHRAADEIAMLGPGIAKVKLKVIPPPKNLPEDVPADATLARSTATTPEARDAVYRPDLPKGIAAKPLPSAPQSLGSIPGGFVVQAGAFSEKARAESLREKMSHSYMDARVIPGTNRLWRVVVGHQLTQDEASAMAAKVRKEFGASLVVPEAQ